MSRYLAFILLALSASSVLAAPQGLPVGTITDTVGTGTGTAGQIADTITGTISARAPAELPQMPSFPDTTTVTRPVLGERSNGKVYSSTTLRKRDWQYPTSTQDCRMSEIPEMYRGLSYIRDGQEYSQDCLSRLALSVPPEERTSCRSIGPNAHGYDEECLFKKAFDEDWKFDVEAAKEAELAWRAANTPAPSSDTWRYLYPSSVADCSVDPRSNPLINVNGWNGFSILPSGVILLDDCILRLILDAQILLDLGTCSAAERTTNLLDINISAAIDLVLREPSTAEVAVNHDLAAPRDLITTVVGVLEALRTGCLLDIVLKLVLAIGIEAKIVAGPLGILELVFDLLAILKL